MAEDSSRREQPQVYPLPQSYNSYTADYNVKRDEEFASTSTMNPEVLRCKKRIKYLAYFAAFVVFQTGIIVLFSLTVMTLRTPKFRVRSATFETFQLGTAANLSFNLRMDAELGVKNANFGNYKFQNSSIVFFYGDAHVSEASVRKSNVGWPSTKKLEIEVDLSSNGLSTNSQLVNDLNSGFLTLNSRSRLSGKVELMFIFKKKKSTSMDCTITIGLTEKAVRDIKCK